MEPVVIVICLALIQYFVFAAQVGMAHGRAGIAAPAMTGNDELERYNRVHLNTLEVLIIFLPAIWLFSMYWNPLIAAAIGVVFLVGRQLYAMAYVKDPAKRTAGFMLTMFSFTVLLIGALVGAIISWVG